LTIIWAQETHPTVSTLHFPPEQLTEIIIDPLSEDN
jgi:hypothetical protein